MKLVLILIAAIAIIVAGGTYAIVKWGDGGEPVTTTVTVTPTTTPTIVVTPTVTDDPVMSANLRFTFTITSPTLNGFELFWDEACTQPVPIDESIVVGDINGEIQLDSWWTASIYLKNTGGGSILYQTSFTDSSYYGYITSIAPFNGQVEPGGVVEFTATIFVTPEATPGETHTAVVSIVAS